MPKQATETQLTYLGAIRDSTSKLNLKPLLVLCKPVRNCWMQVRPGLHQLSLVTPRVSKSSSELVTTAKHPTVTTLPPARPSLSPCPRRCAQPPRGAVAGGRDASPDGGSVKTPAEAD